MFSPLEAFAMDQATKNKIKLNIAIACDVVHSVGKDGSLDQKTANELNTLNHESIVLILNYAKGLEAENKQLKETIERLSKQ